MSIVLQGSTSGSITLQEPAIAGTTVLDLPATSGTVLVAPTALTVPNTTGTVMVSGNMPAFYAFGTTVQTLTNGANTKIILNNELFDTANCFDSTTNYRFTPNVAGYYQINGSASLVSGSATQLSVGIIFKNGSAYSYGTSSPVYSTIQNFITVSNLVYLNGSTDYVELYVYHNLGANWNTSPSQTTAVFSGSLIRAA